MEESRYKEDMALSDIISALSNAELNKILFAGHDAKYWEQTSNQCLEIFANLCCIEINQSASKEFVMKFFPELLECFERML